MIRGDCFIRKQFVDVVVDHHLIEADPLAAEGTLSLHPQGVGALAADGVVHGADDHWLSFFAVVGAETDVALVHVGLKLGFDALHYLIMFYYEIRIKIETLE